jgi:hypothetical protein
VHAIILERGRGSRILFMTRCKMVTILIKPCVLFTMSAASATAERSFSIEVFEKLR